jgi:diacylglycerol kinase (ATP)
MSEYNSTDGLDRILRAFGYSFRGYAACYRHEAAFRQEILAGLVIVPLGIWLGDTGVEKALLAGSWALVIVVELLNSAVEATVDRFGPEHHDLCGRAKDLGSAAVLTSILIVAVVWGLVLFG